VEYVPMNATAVQDFYPDDYAHCYGCGRLNPHGLQFRSTWDGDEAVAHFTPEPYHVAVPGFVYGGLTASLIDCHAMATAALARYRAEGREPGSEPHVRYVTAALKVDYLQPTPLGVLLEARGRVLELTPRKAVVEVRVLARGVVCVRGEVVAVMMPDAMRAAGAP
jgi:acyl-coenzyme A thioesterase PaaI-like protein